jgi:hypothetical protein
MRWARRRRQKQRAHFGLCFYEYRKGQTTCGNRGRLKHHCVLCEKAGKDFTVQFCESHAKEAESKMKRHVLLAHPSTIPAAFLAGLKGELY